MHDHGQAGDLSVEHLRAERAHVEEALRLIREEGLRLQSGNDLPPDGATEDRAAEMVDRIAHLDTLIRLCETLDG